jgi:SAM-dependent methyltransferase
MKNSKDEKDFPYNGEVAHWWLQHAFDDAHERAYRKIADFIRDSYVQDPNVIVDYACGAGNLLFRLGDRFPKSRLVGLDGSSFLLGNARSLCRQISTAIAKRCRFIETPLPNLNIMRGRANLAVFCFPNMASVPECGLYLSENDRKIAKILARDDDPDDTDSIQAGLEQSRVISLNLRRILSRDGICVRVEYATLRREELAPRELVRVAYEEGSLEETVGGLSPRLWFRVAASSYIRSKVLEDVYEQTGDERDRKGGYIITVLKAV